MVPYLISLLKYVLWVFGILNMVDDFIFTSFINGVCNTKKNVDILKMKAVCVSHSSYFLMTYIPKTGRPGSYMRLCLIKL